MPRTDDDGFTLIELLISIILLGIVLAPLVTSFTLGLGTAAEQQQNLTNTTDIQAFSAFFADDVGNSDTVTTGTTTCGGASALVALNWIDGANTKSVAYVASEDTVMETDLHRTPVYRIDRVDCLNGAVRGRLPVARSVAAVPVPRCDGTPCPATATPQRVAITVEEYAAKVADPHLSFTASATRRVTT